MLYALVSPEDTITRIEGNIEPDVGTKPGWRWLLVVDIERPAYNPETHIAEGTIAVEPTQVVRDWIIREKTVEELQNERTAWVNNIERAVMTALHNQENRLLTLENQSTITLEEYKIKLRDLI